MAKRFSLVFVIVEKFSPVSLSKRGTCLVSVTAIMKFCARNMYRSKYASSKRFVFGTNSKKTADSVLRCKNYIIYTQISVYF